jgi:hypothetical protein
MATATASATSQRGGATYRFEVDAMNSATAVGFNTVMPLTSNYVTAWEGSFSNFQLMEMYDQNFACVASGTNACASGWRGANSTSDADTSYDNALAAVAAKMPNPGQGTGAAGDSPQEVLFFVTDGVEDEASGSTRILQQINANGAHNYCSDIKARGIKIAILYTTYLPLPSDSFYVSAIEPFQPDIASALQSCASTGMFYQAGLDDSLSVDFATLFNMTLSQSAPRLTQ